MKPIPIGAGRSLAEQFGYDQVVIVARKVGDDGGEHVTTYGRDKGNCAAAALIGYFFKHFLMKWPGYEMESAPRDGTHILAFLYQAPDDESYRGFGEWREIFWEPYRGPLGQMPWHAGDPFDSHSGREAPEHFGEAVPIAWLPLPATPSDAKFK